VWIARRARGPTASSRGARASGASEPPEHSGGHLEGQTRQSPLHSAQFHLHELISATHEPTFLPDDTPGSTRCEGTGQVRSERPSIVPDATQPCHPGEIRALAGRLTRCRAPDRRRTLPVGASRRNKSPAIAPPGERSQRRTSRFRTGSAASNIEARRATRPRFVDPSAMTRSFETLSTAHPRDRPIFGPSRVFLSSGRSVPCASATTDLTSTIRIDQCLDASRRCRPSRDRQIR
jgi:hypothetical protein